jgi:hypothetical protein
MKTLIPYLLISTVAAALSADAASWWDRLGLGKKPATNAASGLTLNALSQDQMIGGLKEALATGVTHAVAALGKEDGFFKDQTVKIPMPERLQAIERTLRTLHQEKLADEFVTTLNRAAEQAVPEAAAVLGESVKQMTVADAQGILTGTNNAATQYFRRTSETNLYQRFLPLVQRATSQTGVTRAYKSMLDKASFASAFLGPGAGDLDGYVTQKTLDGLFVKIADEEKRIRENPAARTTALLQQVFGALPK